MKKNISILSIALVALMSLFILASCTQDINPPDEVKVSNTFGLSLKSGATVTVNATYKTSYFSSDSSEFNKDLAMLSFTGATSMNKQASQAFYSAMGFSDQMAIGWDGEPTSDSVAYTIASRRIGDSTLIGITVRGCNYGSEWANNLTVGSSGNHKGFNYEADKILQFLKVFMQLHHSGDKNIKIWIMGYSRGGGISGLLSHKIISDGIAKEKDLYTYTFEAPASLGSADTYSCIHNVRNSADIVPYIPPVQWGLYHAGVETNTYSEDLRTYVIEDLGLDQTDFPEFTPGTDYSTPDKFIEYFTDIVLAVDMFSSRSNYVENVQTPATELIPMLMTDKNKGLNALMDHFSKMGLTEILAFLGKCVEDPLCAYNEIKPVFDAAGVKYNDQDLKDVSAFVTKLVNDGQVMGLLLLALGLKDNLTYAVLSHYPEVTFVALNHYDNSL